MQKRNPKKVQQFTPKCRLDSLFLRVGHFIEKVPEYLVYLANWGMRCRMARYANKRGHFSVITTGNGGSKKFLVSLRFLSYPPFIRLLEAAEREYGFDQEGVLAIPCEASELQQILSHV